MTPQEADMVVREIVEREYKQSIPIMVNSIKRDGGPMPPALQRVSQGMGTEADRQQIRDSLYESHMNNIISGHNIGFYENALAAIYRAEAAKANFKRVAKREGKNFLLTIFQIIASFGKR